MGLFGFLKKSDNKKQAVTPPAPRAVSPRTAVPGAPAADCYAYSGPVEEYFAALIRNCFPIYEVRRTVYVEKLLGTGTHVSAPANSWTCGCGAENTGAFCTECGSKKPQPEPAVQSSGPWKCACGNECTGKFCPECGSPRPVVPVSKEWTCGCGRVNEGKFCPDCGTRKPEASAPAPAPAAPAAPPVKAAQGGYVPLSFVLYQGGKPRLAILVCGKNNYDHRNIKNTVEYCESQGIPCQRYFREFRNEASYVRDRIARALR